MFRALRKSKAVFFLFLIFLIFVTLEALIMFRYSWRGYMEGASDTRFASFDNFQDASIVMYIFVTLGENYADVLDVVFDTNRATFLFFAPIAFFGIVFLISLIAATFEQVYKLQVLGTTAVPRKLIECLSRRNR
jgi:hypothetical protein